MSGPVTLNLDVDNSYYLLVIAPQAGGPTGYTEVYVRQFKDVDNPPNYRSDVQFSSWNLLEEIKDAVVAKGATVSFIEHHGESVTPITF